MGYDIFEEVDKLLGVVDDAVVSGDFTNLKQHVGEIVEPMKQYGKNLASSGGKRGGAGSGTRNRNARNGNGYQSGPRGGYNAGHMEGRGNAFYGTYAGPRSGQPGSVPTYQQRAMRSADPLRGETELFKKVENSLVDQVKVIIGAAGTFLAGMITAVMIAVTLGLLIEAEMVAFAATAVFTLFSAAVTAAFVALILNGRKGIVRMQRYVKYRSILMKKSFASVKEISEAVNLPADKVVKELKELTALGFFKQGHFDKKETTFICADEVYRMYQQSLEGEKIRRMEEEERKKQAGYIPQEVQELLDKGNEYVRRIHEANAKIPGQEVTQKLDRMESIVARIFAEVEKNPSLAGNLNMFMDYYLPTTTKLMDAYIDMDAHPVQGVNIQNSKAEIEGTLDTINDAFEKLLDGFFKETALDVSTDISVMKTMMRQQGLTPDDLEMIRRKQERELAGSATIDEMQEYMKEKEKEDQAPTLENIRKKLAKEDARKAREAGKAAAGGGKVQNSRDTGRERKTEEDVLNTAPTLEGVREQLAREDAAKAKMQGAADKKPERPLSFDEQLELEAQQGLLMTGNGDDDDIY